MIAYFFFFLKISGRIAMRTSLKRCPFPQIVPLPLCDYFRNPFRRFEVKWCELLTACCPLHNLRARTLPQFLHRVPKYPLSSWNKLFVIILGKKKETILLKSRTQWQKYWENPTEWMHDQISEAKSLKHLTSMASNGEPLSPLLCEIFKRTLRRKAHSQDFGSEVCVVY